MTPEDALNRAMKMLVSEQYSSVFGKTLENAKDVPVAAATLVYPIVYKLSQETDFPPDELFGNDQGDGIAVHLLKAVFDIAEESGFPQPANEQEARAQAEKAAQILGDLLGQAGDVEQQAMGGDQGAPQPQQPQGLMMGAA